MDFKLSEDQEMLRSLARDFLTKECPKAKVRELERDEKGYDPQMWERMAELGWLGLVFPENYGGTGATFLDLSFPLLFVPCQYWSMGMKSKRRNFSLK
jgi:alkylation response protein AidB-like acyl-CoA dehydrogenase